MGDGVAQTASFLVLTAATTVAVSGWVLYNRSVSRSERVAHGFYILSVVISAAALCFVVAGAAGVHEGAVYVRLLRLLLFRFWIVIGVAIGATGLILLSASGWKRSGADAERVFVMSPYVLRGVCFSVSISFTCTEIGKLSHDADMRQFFLQSGYTIGFMYFIMAAETVGAIGLFLPGVRLAAALGLIGVMSGAIVTHARNHDPFTDSLEALHLLILLGCIVVIAWTQHRVSRADRPLQRQG